MGFTRAEQVSRFGESTNMVTITSKLKIL